MARKRNYLNNRDLLEQIIISKEQGELTPKALEFLMLLADKCSRKLTYRNPEDRQDCIAYAYMDLYRYWRNFNPEKSTNAFAYFTEIALHPKKYHGTVSINGSSDSEGIYTI